MNDDSKKVSDRKSIFSTVMNPDCKIEIADKVSIGTNVVLGARCKKIKIGYGTVIRRDVYIDVDELDIGEYTTIHHGTILHGIKTLIGHNCWIGHYTVIDSLGGFTRIGNNVGIGAHSQLWTHMKFGDVLAGCRWNKSGVLDIEDDVWLVGHCIVSPIKAKARSMLMVGSLLTRDMEENAIYAGSPAVNVSKKFGTQFQETNLHERGNLFENIKIEFERKTGFDAANLVQIPNLSNKNRDVRVTYFDLMNRTYVPNRSDLEYNFIKFMLYEKAKFLPVGV